MESQADQAAALAKSLAAQYKCPVFACGDFNAMDGGGYDPVYDAPEIYSRLSKKMRDTKALAAKTKSGNNKKPLHLPMTTFFDRHRQGAVLRDSLRRSDGRHVRPLSHLC